MDAENPENRFQIGNITPGLSETINLEKVVYSSWIRKYNCSNGKCEDTFIYFSLSEKNLFLYKGGINDVCRSQNIWNQKALWWGNFRIHRENGRQNFESKYFRNLFPRAAENSKYEFYYFRKDYLKSIEHMLTPIVTADPDIVVYGYWIEELAYYWKTFRMLSLGLMRSSR